MIVVFGYQGCLLSLHLADEAFSRLKTGKIVRSDGDGCVFGNVAGCFFRSVLDNKTSEPAEINIFFPQQTAFDYFHQCLHRCRNVFFRKSGLIGNLVDNVCFSHCLELLCDFCVQYNSACLKDVQIYEFLMWTGNIFRFFCIIEPQIACRTTLFPQNYSSTPSKVPPKGIHVGYLRHFSFDLSFNPNRSSNRFIRHAIPLMTLPVCCLQLSDTCLPACFSVVCNVCDQPIPQATDERTLPLRSGMTGLQRPDYYLFPDILSFFYPPSAHIKNIFTAFTKCLVSCRQSICNLKEKHPESWFMSRKI